MLFKSEKILDKYWLLFKGCQRAPLISLAWSLVCNTLGVWLPQLHLHFINMSIIHPIMSSYCMKHALETLQRIVYFMCIVLLWNVKCATLKCNMCHSLSETRLVNIMQQDHETCETWLWNQCNISCVFIVSVHTLLDSCVTNVWCG